MALYAITSKETATVLELGDGDVGPSRTNLLVDIESQYTERLQLVPQKDPQFNVVRAIWDLRNGGSLVRVVPCSLRAHLHW